MVLIMTTAELKKNDAQAEWKVMNESNKQKASLFNFIIYAHEERRVDYFRTLVDNVIEKFPCRVIFIKGNTKDDESDFETEVTLKNVGTVVCDHIEIRAGGPHLQQIPNYILPHLEPDLPIILLWGQDPTHENDVLPKLVEYADRLIFDSECTDQLSQFCRNIVSHLKGFPCQVLDMNWGRLAGWRTVIAEGLDSPERIRKLQNSKTIAISYNSRKTDAFRHNAIQAEYLQCWLAERLGWKFQNNSSSQTKDKLEYTFSGRPITVTLIPVETESVFPGSITHVAIETHDGHTFDFNRPLEEPTQVVVNISSQDKCWLPYTLPLMTQFKGTAFIQKLLYAHSSQHYINMLKMLANENLDEVNHEGS